MSTRVRTRGGALAVAGLIVILAMTPFMSQAQDATPAASPAASSAMLSEGEAIFNSVCIACHQPGGKKSTSPGASVAAIACGATFRTNSGSSAGSAKTSSADVLLRSGAVELDAGLREEGEGEDREEGEEGEGE